VHDFIVKSHSRSYSVEFTDTIDVDNLGTHYIVDSNVYPLLNSKLEGKKILLIDATEETKSYQGIEPIIVSLIEQGLKRDSKLVAIGGGITQDITCFIANTYMRGVEWTFIPTTLLAQADSCIGSKSSINFGPYKNLLGSFTPPNRVIISAKFLDTLEDKDIKSGIGEIIKLLIIDGTAVAPGEITRQNISEYVYKTLQIKKNFIEKDEFDKGCRNILNYGHCFGHGIESATDFAIPHGIAITIGMDIANKFAVLNGSMLADDYEKIHTVLFENYQEYLNVNIDVDRVLTALTKDKKNTGSKINLILPVGNVMEKRGFENSPAFWDNAKNAMS
jgi:3-dehydroquinate synthase